MKRNNRPSERKRGLGRGLEVLLADTTSMESAPSGGAQPEIQQPAPNLAPETEALGKELSQLLKEAEALRILMLEFEMIVQADLH